MQVRQPKGTATGGQFASSANPESTLALNDEVGIDLTQPVESPDQAIAWCEGELAKTIGEYDEMVSAGMSEDPDALELRDYMDELRDQLVGHQRDMIAELRKGAQGAASTRVLGLTRSAYAVDEAIDTLTRWDGGSGANPADVLEHLIDVREEIFLAASSSLVEQWRDKESKIREFERHPGASGLDDDEYEVMRDEREALFQRIYEEALG